MTGKNDVRHLAGNDPAPPPLTEPNKLRIYNMRYCPFAERTLIALEQKGVKDYEIVNVNLSDKPKWFLEASPFGKVPVIEFGPGKPAPSQAGGQPLRIFESDVTVEMLDKLYPSGGSGALIPKDPLLEAQGKCFRALFDSKVQANYMKFFGQDANARKQAFEDVRKGLKELEPKFLGDPFILPGKEPSVVDILLFPFVERLDPAMEAMGTGDNKSSSMLDGMPKWQAWMKACENTPGVKNTARSRKEQVEFLKKYLAKDDNRYD